MKFGFDYWSIREKQRKCKNRIIKRMYSFIYYRMLEKKCSFIGILTEFADKPIFPHGAVGVFISNGARIGKSPVIFQQVTIGSNTLADSKRRGYPTIGDNCYIGAGAKIIGNVKIGHNVRIGANCVVVDDVESDTVVVMGRPRTIKKINMDNTYYQYGSFEVEEKVN